MMESATRRVWSWVLVAGWIVGAAGIALVMTACNTTEGFGKDVKNLGNSIEDSAAENK